MKELLKQTQEMNVIHITGNTYHVFDNKKPDLCFHVNLVENTCDCCYLENAGLPCAHMLAASQQSAQHSWKQQIHPSFKTVLLRYEQNEMLVLFVPYKHKPE